jgi:hypothetical protein
MGGALGTKFCAVVSASSASSACRAHKPTSPHAHRGYLTKGAAGSHHNVTQAGPHPTPPPLAPSSRPRSRQPINAPPFSQSFEIPAQEAATRCTHGDGHTTTRSMHAHAHPCNTAATQTQPPLTCTHQALRISQLHSCTPLLQDAARGCPVARPVVGHQPNKRRGKAGVQSAGGVPDELHKLAFRTVIQRPVVERLRKRTHMYIHIAHAHESGPRKAMPVPPPPPPLPPLRPSPFVPGEAQVSTSQMASRSLGSGLEAQLLGRIAKLKVVRLVHCQWVK